MAFHRIRLLIAGALTLSCISFVAQAEEAEHWSCFDTFFTPPARIRWTIIEGRMFAAGSKGGLSYTVVSNTPTMLVAYLVVSRPHAPFSSTLYVIDKTAKTYVSSDDIIAANSTAFSDDLRPTISKGKCERD